MSAYSVFHGKNVHYTCDVQSVANVLQNMVNVLNKIVNILIMILN